jgi:hypothetical protein
MPIETIDLSDSKYDNYLRNFTNQNWVLCLGAGICTGILPSWKELTRRLVNASFGYNWDDATFTHKLNEVGFSLDSWIQACLNHLLTKGKSISDFHSALEECLYSDLLDKADKAKLKAEMLKMLESPKKLKKRHVYELWAFFDEHYKNSSLLQIVHSLVERKADAKMPHAVITFNADSLLHSLITLYSIRYHSALKGEYCMPPEEFRKVTRSFQSWANSIPIFHLHGSISPEVGPGKTRDSRDSLIFLESSYSEVANNMYSWAQSTFLFSAAHSKLVFVGLSMTDPNIRKWLAWTNQAYQSELNTSTGGRGKSLTHLWIRPKAGDVETQSILDISLHHLGTKIGLVQDYGKIGEAIRRIM